LPTITALTGAALVWLVGLVRKNAGLSTLLPSFYGARRCSPVFSLLFSLLGGSSMFIFGFFSLVCFFPGLDSFGRLG